MRGSLIMTPILAVALAACQSQEAARAPAAPPSQTDAEKVVADAEAAWSSGQVERVMANYADGAVVFDSSTLAPTTDRNVQTRANAAFLTMKPADFRVEPRHVQALDDDTIVASGVLAFTAQVGATRQLIRTRYSQVYQKQADGRWLIVHEHMSAPPAGTAMP
ncbi:SgcJ/EcaC family oxidoreductase [Sphingomonas sp. LY160]|uniref:SgcJ/EcaC family oxidoreductase n=1 Tax=Sphingomonas sp. LY160 TaxID=3095342 RepID=UPI002ADEE421|nr:SgcJ/EcaC family oxidoreductase [Sphingomonas sp. LY160]MEA1071254.1 SgcJ/EcaC family oxidoreductase [Sphingomonas sp. LY160]